MSDVYVAGPLGFTAGGRHYLESVVLPALSARGFTALNPWADKDGSTARALDEAVRLDGDSRLRALAEVNRALGRRNAELIERADGVLAHLDGTDVDSGTAAEIGFAAALGRPVVGWRDDLRSSGENEATPVNLQVAYFVERAGGTIEPTFEDALDAIARLLA
jgi:nucleoside 2-deoxyribosyltransferase